MQTTVINPGLSQYSGGTTFENNVTKIMVISICANKISNHYMKCPKNGSKIRKAAGMHICIPAASKSGNTVIIPRRRFYRYISLIRANLVQTGQDNRGEGVRMLFVPQQFCPVFRTKGLIS